MARRPRSARAPAARSATSAPTPTISPTIRRDRRSTSSRAELTSFGAGRALDDNVQIMLRYANGARGALWASQVAPGNENGLRIRVYGTKAGLALGAGEAQRHAAFAARPVDPHRRPAAARTQGAAAARVTRIPPGHPEGYLEAFANIYSEIALAIKAARDGQEAARRRPFPDHRRRRQRPRVHRGGGEVVEGQREVGEAVSALPSPAEGGRRALRADAEARAPPPRPCSRVRPPHSRAAVHDRVARRRGRRPFEDCSTTRITISPFWRRQTMARPMALTIEAECPRSARRAPAISAASPRRGRSPVAAAGRPRDRRSSVRDRAIPGQVAAAGRPRDRRSAGPSFRGARETGRNLVADEAGRARRLSQAGGAQRRRQCLLDVGRQEIRLPVSVQNCLILDPTRLTWLRSNLPRSNRSPGYLP